MQAGKVKELHVVLILVCFSDMPPSHGVPQLILDNDLSSSGAATKGFIEGLAHAD